MRRLLNLVPPGTVAVGGGLALLGLASYVHLAAAGHSLDDAAAANLSTFWAIVFTVGLGVFVPVEQEITRLVAAQRTGGAVDTALLRRAWTVAAGTLAVLCAGALLAARPLANMLFGGDVSFVWLLCGALAALALSHSARGALGGFGRFGRYGVQLGLDGALRIGLAVGFSIVGLDSAAWFCAILIIAPVLAALVTLPRAEATGDGPGVSWRILGRGLAILTVSALLSQVIVNVGVINVRLFDRSNVQLATALLSALVLVRIPLFVFASLQASLLPGLATLLARGDRAGYQRMLLRTLGVVSALGALGGLVMVSLGPWLIKLLFDAPDLLTRADFGWLAAGTIAYLWAVVLGQGVLAQGNHRDLSLAWLLGVAALIGVTLLPGSVATRVELGYAVGSLVVALGMVAALILANRREPAVIARAAAEELAELAPTTPQNA